MPHPILLYDGVCGLCNRFVQFLLRHDPDGIFRFASLQSAFADRILARHNISPADLDTVYVVVNRDSHRPPEFLLSRSDAVLFALKQLGALWRSVAFLVQLLPRLVRDRAYNAVARRRYRIFGKFESCGLPSAQDRSRFLDL
ncbi:MAG: DCC1-like thiol-disulfide oxidoreductase family protein [Candidatus Sulfotelmatobacter sp.]